MSGIRSVEPKLSLCILIIFICGVAAKMPGEVDKNDDPLSKYDDSWPKPTSASAYSPTGVDRYKRDWPYSSTSLDRLRKPRLPYMSHNWYRPYYSRYPSIYNHNLLGRPTRPSFPDYAPWMRPGGYGNHLPRPRPPMGLTPLPGKPRLPYMSHNWYRPYYSRYPSIYNHNLLGRPSFSGYAPWMRPGDYSSHLPRPRPSMGLDHLPGFLGSSSSSSIIEATNRLSRAVERIANMLERR